MLKEMAECGSEGRSVKGVELVDGEHQEAARVDGQTKAVKRVIRKLGA
jgi:hypothetical protein